MNNNEVFLKKNKGVTLLELMLVIAIMASFLVIGFRLYNEYLLNNNINNISNNVDQLFQSLKTYYQTNCATTLKTATTQTININIQRDLQSPGYLRGWNTLNPLIDQSQPYSALLFHLYNGAGNNYSASVYACTNAKPTSLNGQYTISCSKTSTPQALDNTTPPNATVSQIVWKISVVAKLSPNLTLGQANAYAAMLAPTCISSQVASCSASPPPPSKPAQFFLIWDRLATFISPNITSDLWPSQAYAKQFNMQYSNDGMAALTGIVWKDTTSPNNYDTSYFLCGE